MISSHYSFFDPSIWYEKLYIWQNEQIIEDEVVNYRSFWAQVRVSANGFLYSILLPFNIQTIKSLAFINKFLFYLTVIFLLHKKAITNFTAILLIISPTIIIHTSTSLRDIIVLLILLIGAYYTFKEKKIGMQLLACILLLIFRAQYIIAFLTFIFLF